jgi:hypothetical protein
MTRLSARPLRRSRSRSPERSGCSLHGRAANSAAVYAYSDNYLADLKHAVIMDLEETTTLVRRRLEHML